MTITTERSLEELYAQDPERADARAGTHMHLRPQVHRESLIGARGAGRG